MEAIKYLKQMFLEEMSLGVQISLFAMAGIFALFFARAMANYIDIIFEQYLFINVSIELMSRWANSFVSVITALYALGYGFQLMKNSYNHSEKLLSDFSLAPFVFVFFSVPLVLCWIFYYFVTYYIGLFIFYNLSWVFGFFIWILCMIATLPFTFVILSEHVGKNGFQLKLYNPFYIFKVIWKTFWKILPLTLLFCIFVGLVWCAIYNLFYLILPFSISVNTTLKLVGFCFLTYLALNILYVYLTSIACITEKSLRK